MVITLDKHKKPLSICSERRERILLTKKRACIYRYYPFTIIPTVLYNLRWQLPRH